MNFKTWNTFRAVILIVLCSLASCGKKNSDGTPVGDEAISDVDPSSVTGEINGSDPAAGGVGHGASVFPNSPSISSLKLSAPEKQHLLEDETAFSIPFTFSDDVDLVSCMEVTAKSNSSTLFDEANLVIGGTSPKCTITITPNPNQFGSSRITLMAKDKLSNMVSASFEIKVDSVDDMPSLSKVLDQTTAKNVMLSGVNVDITDPDSPLTCSGSLKANSSNSLVLADSGILISGDAPHCQISFSPVSKAVGSSVVTLTLGEGDSRVMDTFTFVVSQTHAVPSLLAPGNQSMNEDQVLSNVAFTLNDADGDANCLDVMSSSDKPTILSSGEIVISGSAPNCVLSLSPKSNQFGAVLVTLDYTDPTSLSSAASFTVLVKPVNDGPTVDPMDSVTISENTSLLPHSVSIHDIDSDLACSLSLSAVVADESILNPASVSFSGTAPDCHISATPEVDAYGSTLISVKVTDGEYAAISTFTLNVTRASTPSTPVLSNAGVTISNTSNLTISGTCTSGLLVNLSGSVQASEVIFPAPQLTQACAFGAFSFIVHKDLDGTYSFALRQKNGSAFSPQVFKNWTRDTQIPVSPEITTPSNLTYASGPDSVLLKGACELGSVVIISRNGIPLTPSPTCVFEEFSQVITESLDGTYAYSVKQVDLAGNESLPILLSWSVDSTVPSNPVLNQAPINYNNLGQFTISGSCSGSNKVYIRRNDLDILGSPVSCSSGAFTISTTQANDGIYDYSVFQEDVVNEFQSGVVDISWIKDSVAPSAPVVTYPTSIFKSTYKLMIKATCEVDAKVYLKENGSLVNAGSPYRCADGNFEYTVVKNDLNPVAYIYMLYQDDEASNSSLDSAAVTWNFDPLSINPVTIDTPLDADFITATDSLLVSGSCDEDMQVILAGLSSSEIIEPLGALQQQCSNSLDYRFVLKKSVGGIANISISQSNGIATSSPMSFVWTFDNIAPTLVFTKKPSDPNLYAGSSFSFNSDDPNATIECSLDGQPFATCTSGYSNSSISNGTHTLIAKAVDEVGNSSSTISYQWLQNSNKTLALYHFTHGTDFTDSSLYANGDLTNSGTTSGTGKFSEDRVVGTGSKLFVSDKTQFQASANEFTVEAWIKMATLPSNGTWQTIVAKSFSASAGVSYILQIGKESNRFKLQAKLSSSGSAVSSYKTGSITVVANTWYHVALTFKAGAYKIYLNGVSKKSGTAVEKSIYNSTSNLTLGTDGTNQFKGEIDEVRLSQILRYTTTFSPSTSPFNAD